MHKHGAALAAIGILAFAAGAAQAQDTASWANGFYVRGDVGGAIGGNTTFHDTNPNSPIAVLAPSTARAETGTSALFGGGIGYRLNPIFRGDVTLDSIPGLRANLVTTGPTNTGFAFGSGNLDSLVGMGNAYVQLDGLLPGAFGAFQPYVDGGVGFARNHLATVSVDGAPGASLSGSTQTNFAWGVGTGIAYPITPSISLDFAYRFLDLGRTATGTIGTTGVSPIRFMVTSARSDDLTVQTITAGLRWSFGPVAPLAASAASGAARDLFWWVPNGLYMRGDLGAAIGDKLDFKGTGPIVPGIGLSSARANIDNSAIFGTGLGYRFSPLFRADVTIDDMPSLHGSGKSTGFFAGTTASADIHSLVGLVNGYLDVNGLFPGVLGPIQPFIDGGVGLARNEMSPATGVILGLLPYGLNGATRTNFAWGAGAGIGYAITPHLTAEIAYKYLDLGPVDTGGSLQIEGIVALPIPKLRSNDLTAHTVTAGLRWSFGAAAAPPPTLAVAPPPPAPPAAVPAKQKFIVFFEFDKSSLTLDGQKIVDAAAAAYKTGKSDIAIAGYTDLAGTAPYNLALSHRRADTVKAALVKDGVPASAIGESWFGKENPRVPTADGVREPQNRRVEIAM